MNADKKDFLSTLLCLFLTAVGIGLVMGMLLQILQLSNILI